MRNHSQLSLLTNFRKYIKLSLILDALYHSCAWPVSQLQHFNLKRIGRHILNWLTDKRTDEDGILAPAERTLYPPCKINVFLRTLNQYFARIVLNSGLTLYVLNYNSIFKMSLHCNDPQEFTVSTQGWRQSVVHIISADSLATCVARQSADMILTKYFSKYSTSRMGTFNLTYSPLYARMNQHAYIKCSRVWQQHPFSARLSASSFHTSLCNRQHHHGRIHKLRR